jgi:hypothetical protein
MSMYRRTVASVEQGIAAVGITSRSSSAVLVAVGAPPESPRLLDRRKVYLVRGTFLRRCTTRQQR